MKIVVTGGNGNIGAHIIRELLQRGYKDIVCFDRTECPAPLDHVQYLVGDRMSRNTSTPCSVWRPMWLSN